jgi:hypothetical protein
MRIREKEKIYRGIRTVIDERKSDPIISKLPGGKIGLVVATGIRHVAQTVEVTVGTADEPKIELREKKSLLVLHEIGHGTVSALTAIHDEFADELGHKKSRVKVTGDSCGPVQVRNALPFDRGTLTNLKLAVFIQVYRFAAAWDVVRPTEPPGSMTIAEYLMTPEKRNQYLAFHTVPEQVSSQGRFHLLPAPGDARWQSVAWLGARDVRCGSALGFHRAASAAQKGFRRGILWHNEHHQSGLWRSPVRACRPGTCRPPQERSL